MLNLSLNKLKVIAIIRGNKDYKSMSEEGLIYSINESESVKKSEKNFDDARIEKIKKDFNKLRDRLSKPKINRLEKDLYRTENKKIKDIEKNLLKLEKNLSKLKKYYDYDDIECKEIRDVKNLFDLSIDKDYYKTLKTLLLITVILNMKVKEIRTKLFQLKNILI